MYFVLQTIVYYPSIHIYSGHKMTTCAPQTGNSQICYLFKVHLSFPEKSEHCMYETGKVTFVITFSVLSPKLQHLGPLPHCDVAEASHTHLLEPLALDRKCQKEREEKYKITEK